MDIQEIFNFNKPYNKNIIDELIDKIKTNKIVPYVGAGMSFLEDDIYPTWGKFLTDTVVEYELDDQEFNKTVDFEEKATYLHSELGNVQFPKHLKKTFNPNKLDQKLDWSNKAVQVIPKIFDIGLIVTTNYDKVLEKVYANDNKILTPADHKHTEALNSAIYSDDLLLYKIHGDIIEPETSIILTKEQYDQVYSDDDFKKVIKQIFNTKELLFLGCSLQKDRPLKIMQECLSEGKNCFSIVACENDKQKIRVERLRLENEFRIQSIIYPNTNHECVKIILDYIFEKTRQVENSLNTPKKLELTDEWFSHQNKYAIQNLGNRYLPDINVELKISETFDAMSRNEKFISKIKLSFENVIQAYNSIQYSTTKYNDEINDLLNEIQNYINDFKLKSNDVFEVDKLNSYIDKLMEAIDNIINKLSTISTVVGVLNNANAEHSTKKSKINHNSIYEFKELNYHLEEFKELINTDEVTVVNNPYVLLHGTGGRGKSHLLADTVSNREKNGQKSIFLLGQHFINETNPLSEITRLLNLECSIDELLQELDKIAKNEEQRIIIFIDALNEGNGKKLWFNHLYGFLEKIKQYDWLGFVASIRSEYVDDLFFENEKLENSLIKIEHYGFQDIRYEAIKKYFAFYGIPYIDMPLVDEFSNPLFLRLFCQTYENSDVDISNITLLEIFNNYITHINVRVSKECAYDKRLNLVEKILNAIVVEKYINKGINIVKLDKIIEIISEVERQYNLPNKIFSELISCGLLTQNISHGEEYAYITYEKIEDYLYSQLLVSELKNIGTEKFYIEYSYLIDYEDVLDMFTISLNETKTYEIFEIFKESDDYYTIEKVFLNALRWRSSCSVSAETRKYVDEIILEEPNLYELFFETMIGVSTKNNFHFNAKFTCKLIKDLPMADRDSLFIPLFDYFYNKEGNLKTLIEWCFEEHKKTSNETLLLTGLMISTCFITSNNTLRNKATRAMVNLLKNNTEIALDLIEFYKDIDDPYLVERLYAVTFGIITFEQDLNKIEKIALYTYENIFNQDLVYENVLVRNYAKNIVEYAKNKSKNSEIASLNVTPPYNSKFPSIPTDEEATLFNLDYRITSSMQVDMRGGGYGDFGRYTFQSYFREWAYALNPYDLMKIALKKIHSYGYDNEKHLLYDKSMPYGRGGDNRKERIGKKYQWIAFYELVAQVSDNYKMKISGYRGDEVFDWCRGNFDSDVRSDIDPTLIENSNKNNKSKLVHSKLYEIPNISNELWLESYNDVPSADSLLTYTYNNEEFVLLSGWYKWKDTNKFSKTQKDMFIFVSSYIVKSKDYGAVEKLLKSKKSGHRCLEEPPSNHVLYNREYFWSESFEYYNEVEDRHEWQVICYEDLKERKAMIPTKIYFSERRGEEEYLSGEHYKPCESLYNELEMEYGDENFVMYDKSGNVICFDSKELLNEEIGFFINKKKLFEFLEQNDYKIIWRFVSEKTVRTVKNSLFDAKYSRLNMSDVVTINDSGDFDSNLHIFKD